MFLRVLSTYGEVNAPEIHTHCLKTGGIHPFDREAPDEWRSNIWIPLFTTQRLQSFNRVYLCISTWVIWEAMCRDSLVI